MGVPVSTTTVSVRRLPAQSSASWRDPTDPELPRETVASAVRAHISTSQGREAVVMGASQEVVAFRLACDPFPAGLHHEDQIVDDKSGETYRVVWAHARTGFELDHFTAGLQQITGVV